MHDHRAAAAAALADAASAETEAAASAVPVGEAGRQAFRGLLLLWLVRGASGAGEQRLRLAAAGRPVLFVYFRRCVCAAHPVRGAGPAALRQAAAALVVAVRSRAAAGLYSSVAQCPIHASARAPFILTVRSVS